MWQHKYQRRTRGGQGGWQDKLLEKQLRGNTSIKEEQEGVRVAGRVSC